MSDSDFFSELKPWSKRKHRLLSKYLPPFAAKVASTIPSRTIYCIDCFAGAAKYDDGSDGSPILMAQTADIAKSWMNPVNLRLINVEPKTKNFLSLETHTKNWTDSKIITNINGDFSGSLNTIFNQIGDAPALFFIDPFGPKTIPFDSVKRILTRNQKISELIINFDADGLRRIADSVFSKATDSTTIKSIPAKIHLVNATLGTDEWFNVFKEEKLTTKQRENYILNLYVKNFSKFGYHVVSYPIRESIDKSPEYYYIYCTRHFDGIDLMNDFVRQEEDLIYDEHVESSMSLFMSDNALPRIEDERRAKLRIIVLDYLRKHQQKTRKQIRQALISPHFAEFSSKDYRQVIQDLITDKIVKSVDGKQKVNDDDILIFSTK